MSAHLIYKITTSRQSETKKDLIKIRKSYKQSLLECIRKNFTTIENVFPFYDSEDEYGNNLFFKDTPKGVFDNHFSFLNWRNHKCLSDFQQLNCYDIRSLQLMLNLQDILIYPDYNGDFEEIYYTVQTWEIQ